MLERKIGCILCCSVGVLWTLRSIANPQAGVCRGSVDSTVTELYERSGHFKGKRVRVRAAFESDGIERSLLLEPDCDLEGTGIRPPQSSRDVTSE